MKAATDDRPDIKDLSLAELGDALHEMGVERYRAQQIWAFLYRHRHRSFDSMHTLKKELRQRLAERFRIGWLELVEEKLSSDGTRAFLFGLDDGRAIESVLIPDARRLTLCVSSQVGCAYACRFCLTGYRGYVRNLRAAEIVGQVLAAQDLAGDASRITNLVYMGQGEPLANIDPVFRSIEALTSPWGVGISGRRITVSTVGLVPGMRRLVLETPVELAVSLHSADDAVRSRLVPSNRKYPLDDLLEACRDLELRKRSRITFEYTLLAGVNDSDEAADQLARRLRGIRTKINVIPFNAFAGAPFEPTPPEGVERFAERMRGHGYQVNVRRTRGADVHGACGMLSRVATEGPGRAIAAQST